MGTIMGLRKKVRNVLLNGMRLSMITASHRDSITARGTAITENSSVLRAASEKALFCQVRIKLLKPTYSCWTGLLIIE